VPQEQKTTTGEELFLSAVSSVSARTLMAVTIEDLYRSYGVLADAKDNLSQVNKEGAFILKRV